MGQLGWGRGQIGQLFLWPTWLRAKLEGANLSLGQLGQGQLGKLSPGQIGQRQRGHLGVGPTWPSANLAGSNFGPGKHVMG